MPNLLRHPWPVKKHNQIVIKKLSNQGILKHPDGSGQDVQYDLFRDDSGFKIQDFSGWMKENFSNNHCGVLIAFPVLGFVLIKTTSAQLISSSFWL
jgi:hypothetical protein